MARTPELRSICQRAEELARARREAATTVHLLAVVVDAGGVVSDLLRERKLTGTALLSPDPLLTHGEADALRGVLNRAREIASSLHAPEPTALHLLSALLATRGTSAYRALGRAGVDIPRLRLAATNVGLGLPAVGVTAQRRVQSQAASAELLPKRPTRPASRAVSVPLQRVVSRGTAKSPRPVSPPPPNAAAPSETVALSDAVELRKAAVSNDNAGRRKLNKARFALDPKRSKLLCAIGRNLTQAAYLGELPSVVGREAEVERLLDVLAKREGKNPCLVGPPGVGKTSVVHALAYHTANAGAAHALDPQLVIEIPFSELFGSAVRGSLSERMSRLQSEVKVLNGRVVLFFDDAHQLFGDAPEELVAELKRGLLMGEIACIGATTSARFEQFIEADPALQRCFTRVEIEEPDTEDACEMVEHASRRFEAHHGTEYTEAALASTIAWSTRYLTGRAMPDRAISVLDLAAARCRRRDSKRVEAEHVAEVVAELADVPLERLLESDGERLLRLEQSLEECIVGHGAQLERIARIIRRNAAGLGGQRPIGTFLLLGPTGVGKTETAKSVAQVLFGSANAMTRIDLSEYSEPHSVARLIGSPPGYVGHEAGGQLTEAVRRRPYQVLLLDEIEKAHNEVLETFLPLLDEGRLTDGRGRTVDFTNTVIFLTSNLGAREATPSTVRQMGFGQRQAQSGDVEARVIAAARERLSPEFWNRLDEALVFSALSRDDVAEIARRLLQELADRVYEQRDVELHVEPSVIELLLDAGFDASLGARPIRRAIARSVEAPLAEALLKGELVAGSRALLSRVERQVEIRPL